MDKVHKTIDYIEKNLFYEIKLDDIVMYLNYLINIYPF